MDARTVGRIGLRTVIAAASAATLVLTGMVWGLQHRLDVGRVVSNAIPDAAPTPVGEEFTALLVGLDARTDANGNPLPQALLDALHAGPDEGQLHTDTIMLLHVPAESNGSAVAISIPRDSFVQIAGGRGKHKINSAYQRGLKDAEDALREQGISGPELDRRGREAGRSTLIATVADLTGLTIDHFAEINLAGFVELTDAVGGVPVCLNAPVKDSYSGIDLPAGEQTVSGPGALAFVRQRHGLTNGDLDRTHRQQAFLASAAHQLESAGVFDDLGKVGALLDVARKDIVVDSDFDLLSFMHRAGAVTSGNVTFYTLPIKGFATEDGESVNLIDPAQVRSVAQRLLAGQSPDESASGPGSSASATQAASGPVIPQVAAEGSAPTPAPITRRTVHVGGKHPHTVTVTVPVTQTPAPVISAPSGVPCVN